MKSSPYIAALCVALATVVGLAFVPDATVRAFILILSDGFIIACCARASGTSGKEAAKPVAQRDVRIETPMVPPAVNLPVAASPTPPRDDRIDTAQEELRQLSASASSLSSLAGQLGRATHDTNENATATTGAIDRITAIVGTSVATAVASDAVFTEITTAIDKAAAMMEAAQRQTTESERLVADLSVASSKVARITAAITRVAAQTRLLALNATIEASRAGDQGRGFAVVANEVKQLSGQASTSAEEITAIIRDIDAKVDAVQTAIRTLAGGMGEVGSVVAQLTTANARQSESNRQVGEALRRSATDTDAARNCAESLTRAAQEAGAIVKELELATNQLTRQADGVIHTVEASLVDFTTLTVLEWEGYFSKFAKEFEAYARDCGQEIRLVVCADAARAPLYLEGPDQLLRLLKEREGEIDIVSPTNSYFKMGQGALFDATIPLDLSRLTHWSGVLASLRNASYAQSSRGTHAVPLLGGSVGLCWNARLLSEPPRSWRCFTDPAFKGKTGLTDGQWETNLYIAALLAGVPLARVYDPPAAKDPEIQRHLDAMVANAGYFWGGQAEPRIMRTLLVTTDYWPGIAAANAEGQDWRLASPVEGQTVWIDTMAITTTAAADPAKLDAAYLLLDFMLSPETQLKILTSLGVSTVNGDSARLMTPDQVKRFHVGDGVFFDPAHMFQPLSPGVRARFESMWQRALKHRVV